MIELPEYTDGVLDLYRIIEKKVGDFPDKVLENTNLRIWYRELSVFDKTKYEFDQGGKEVTMKLRIPMYKGIDSNCVCVIHQRQHIVFNATHVKDKNGFPETEITLIRPEKELNIV